MRMRGFTLIELLVVILIISVLSTVVFAAVTLARARANDAKRMGDLRELQKALELYALDHNGTYPVSTSWYCNDPVNPLSLHMLVAPLAPYAKIIPNDPSPYCSNPNTSWGRNYIYISNGRDYKLIAHEPQSPTSAPRSILDPERDGPYPQTQPCTTNDAIPSAAWAYAVYSSANSMCW